MIDIVLLRIMKYQSEFRKLIRAIPTTSLDPKTKALLDDFGKYFDKFKEHEKIDLQVFLPRFKSWHPGMDPEVLNSYIGILRNIQPDVDDQTKVGIVGDLYEADAAMRIANVCAQYESGDLDAPLPDMISSIVDAYKMNIGARSANWNDTDIGYLLQEDLTNEGVKWRLKCLNESMRPMRGGDFGIIAGRPDKGKTTFLSSEVTFMAPQLADDRNVIWLNNEGMSGRIVKRLYQSALGVSITELVKLNEQKKLRKMYEEKVGRIDRIRVFDIHGMHVGQVEAIIEQSNPGVILYDMIDNIRGFGNEARTDLQLEEMYKWARERSVKYDAIGLATSQISADGDGLQFPTLSMLKDSKTGKQGACDFQLMIGASNQAELEYSRFLSLPKNKLRRDGAPGDPHCEVKFEPTKARYEDIGYGS
jgi:replicative DNA helicase